MAQRRTREILTVVFLCVALGAQVLNPVLYQHGHSLPFGLSSTTLARISDGVVQSQRFLPPGVASASILKASLHDDSGAGMSLAWLLLWMAAAGGMLVIRLKAESRGENLSEAPRRSTAVARPASRQPRGSGFSGPVAAVFGKDLRYLLRSGPLLYALASPPVMVFLFSSFYRTGAYASISSGDALPLSLIWAFLGLTRLVYNNFGAEGAGIQSYFLSPTPLRSVVLGKNVLYLLLFGIEAVVIAALVIFRFGPPPPALAAATVAWLLFAVPANFAAGNVISILLPYRTSATRIKSESASLGNTFLSMFIQFAVLGVGVAVFLPLAAFGRPWLASLVLLLLAAISIGIYFRVLNRIDGMVERHRESITFQVMKMRA